MEDRGPLGWALVLLLLPADSFEFLDNTGGQAAYGPFAIITRDGLVRVDRAGQHVGTLKQSHWGLLSAAYDAEDLCAALPAWMAGVDKEEGTRGVPSVQFWTQV